MPTATPLDHLPLWAVTLVTLVLVLVSVEAGFRLGGYRRRISSNEDRPPVGEMVAATLGLLAFMLAFTFGLAGNWFDVRRRLVVDEANAIGTTYLRAGLLPEPHQSSVRELLRDYLACRIRAADPKQLVAVVDQSQDLHDRLWHHAEAVGRQSPTSETVALFIESLNQLIDLHAERLAYGVRTRMPLVIWLALYLLAVVGTSALGYHDGLSGGRRSLALLAVVFAFTITISLIVDLDRPQEGTLRVSQQSLIDLQRSLLPVATPSR